jgi:hypothetical protein
LLIFEGTTEGDVLIFVSEIMHGMPRKLVSSFLLGGGGGPHARARTHTLYYTSCTQKFGFEHHTWKLRVVLKKLGLVNKDKVQEVWSEGLKLPNSFLPLFKV